MKSATSSEPWQAGKSLWGGDTLSSKAEPAATSRHAEEKFADVEQRLQDHAQNTVAARLESVDQKSGGRLEAVET